MKTVSKVLLCVLAMLVVVNLYPQSYIKKALAQEEQQLQQSAAHELHLPPPPPPINIQNEEQQLHPPGQTRIIGIPQVAHEEQQLRVAHEEQQLRVAHEEQQLHPPGTVCLVSGDIGLIVSGHGHGSEEIPCSSIVTVGGTFNSPNSVCYLSDSGRTVAVACSSILAIYSR